MDWIGMHGLARKVAGAGVAMRRWRMDGGWVDGRGQRDGDVGIRRVGRMDLGWMDGGMKIAGCDPG